MAEAVHSARELETARRPWRPSPAVAHAVRLGVAVSAAIWLANAPGLAENRPTWILITVLMLVQPTTGAALMKSLLRGVGTLAGAFSSILLFGYFSQDPPLLMAGLFVVQAVAAYGFSGTRFQYAWFVWGFTTAIVLGDAMTGQGAVETIAFQRASMVGIGILLVFVVDSLLWPMRAESSLRKSLATRALDLGERLGRVIAPASSSSSAEATDSEASSGELASQLALVAAARTELGTPPARVDALQRLAAQLELLATFARLLADPIVPAGAPDAEERRSFDAASKELARRVEAALRELAAALQAARPPVRFADDLDQAMAAIEAEQRSGVERIGWHASLAGRAAKLRDLVAVLRQAEAAVSQVDAAATTATATIQASLRFRTDPFRVKVALRGGIAVVLVFLLMGAFGWPINTVVAPVAFLMAVAPTRGAALETGIQLGLVLALGWLVADFVGVYVMPHLGRAPLALVVPFAIAGAFAYLGDKIPRLANLPSVGAVVALLALFGSTSAPTDVYGAYNTVCYMALAVVVGSLCGRLLWPTTAADLFRKRAAENLALCRDAVRELTEVGALQRDRAENLFRRAVENSSSLASLHAQARREPIERALDASRRAQIISLSMDLVEAVLAARKGFVPAQDGQADAASGPRIRALREALESEQEALLASMQASSDVLRGEAGYRTSELASAHRNVERRIEELRSDSSELPESGDEQIRRFLVQFDARRELVARQQAIDDWLAEWHGAEQGGNPT